MTRAEMDALIQRVEQASGPSRELDAEIWLACTPGATRNRTGYLHKASGRWCDIDETRDASRRLVIVPAYTLDLNAAVSLYPEEVPTLIHSNPRFVCRDALRAQRAMREEG